MLTAASRDLRNNTRGLLDKVAEGETITITIDGRPVAELRPIEARQRFASREKFLTSILRQADSGLAAELRDLLPDTTDDLEW